MKENLPFFVALLTHHCFWDSRLAKKLNLVRRIESVAQAPLTKEDILDEFPDVFTGLGCMEGSYHIKLEDTVEPVIHPPWRVP